MIPKILRWWVNSVPRRVCAWLEACVCNMMKREEEEQGVSWDAWVGVDEVEHRSLRLCRLPPPHLCFPLLPAAVSPPPLRCQVACPGQMISECTTAAGKDRQKKMAPLWIYCEAWTAASVSVCVFGRPHAERYEQIKGRGKKKKKKRNSSTSFEIVSASCGGHFVTASGQRYWVCVFLRDGCAIRAPAVKLLASI